MGHITDACKSKPQVHKVELPGSPQADPTSDSVDPFSVAIYNLSAEGTCIEIPVELNGHSLLMELDTGAGVSFHRRLKISTSRELNSNPLILVYTPTQGTQSKSVVNSVFSSNTKVRTQSVPLLVVEGSGPSLFGRDWLSHIKLDWKKICSTRVSDSSLPQNILARLRTTIVSP